MDREHPTELLPLLEGATGFDVVLRGYDRHQVQEHVERLEADLHIALAERDAASTRTAELANQLAGAHAQIEALHNRIEQADLSTPESVSERIKSILALARQEATDAERSAEEIRRRAREETADLREKYQRLNAEVEQRLSSTDERAAAVLADAEHRASALLAEAEQRATALLADAEQRAGTLVADAEKQATHLLDEAERRCAEADAAAASKRRQAGEDFEIALRARRTEEARIDEERRTASIRDAEERRQASIQAAQDRLAQARAEADKLVVAARQEVQNLATTRSTMLNQLSALRSILDRVPGAVNATGEEWPAGSGTRGS